MHHHHDDFTDDELVHQAVSVLIEAANATDPDDGAQWNRAFHILVNRCVERLYAELDEALDHLLKER